MIRLAEPKDLGFIQSVLNHPKVRPQVWHGTDEIDASDCLDWMWVLVEDDCGVMMAEAIGDGMYIGLTAYLPEAWGLKAVISMKNGIRRIFTDTDCHRIYGTILADNERAIRNLQGIGFKAIHKRGNRYVGHIDYMDLLDMDMFRATAKAGWGGKAMYWWNIKAKLEDGPSAYPMHESEPVFSIGGECIDLREVSHGD